MQGPFVTDAAPEFGHQLKLVPRDIYRVGIAALERWSKANQGKPFAELEPSAQDDILQRLEAGQIDLQDLPAKLLFGQLLQNTHEGFFSDPQHGGNRGLVGWKLVGFPAPAPTSWTGPTAARSIPSAGGDFRREGLNMATTLKPVDAVVVGFGWTGAILAKELTEAGLNVVALERGENRDTYPDGAYPNTLDELTYNTRGKLFQNLSKSTVSIRHGINDTALPYRQLSAFLPGDGVGGAGLHWSGVHFRIMPEELRLRSHYEERYGKKFIPEGMTIQDYGVSYEELEPHFDFAEKVFGTSGTAHTVKGQVVGKGNPFAADRSDDFPLPALRQVYSAQLFRKAAEELGLHPYDLPAANASGPWTNPTGCRWGRATSAASAAATPATCIPRPRRT